MTLLKQTTVARADDNLTSTEKEDDLQTDCCTLSLTAGSLEKELQTLTLSDAKSGKSEQSCESGIASFSTSYSIQSADTDRTDSIKQRSHGSVKQDLTTPRTEHKCSRDEEVCFSKDHKMVHMPEDKDAAENRKKKDKGEKIVDCWDEMCGSFPDKDGDTLLHLAVLQTVTHLSQVVRLLGLQGQVNCRNRLYQTPLHLAVLTANTPALTLLRSLGASPCLQDCHGNTPLHTACLRNDPLVLRLLLEGQTGEADSVVGEEETRLHTPKAVTSCSGRLRDDPHHSGSLPEKDISGERKDGCDVDTRGEQPEGTLVSDDDTLTGDLEVDREEDSGRRQRLEREVKVALCAKNYEGFTCLHLAVLHANADLVALLLQHGADVNAKDGKSGRTALHLAVDTSHPSSPVLSTLLLHPQLHINATNFAQQTALQLARGRHHLDLVDLLHMRGARWSDSIHGYYSSDSFSEEDAEDDLFLPYDDLRVAGQLLTSAKCS